jgi:hypothetical protein
MICVSSSKITKRMKNFVENLLQSGPQSSRAEMNPHNEERYVVGGNVKFGAKG